jgi:hypothetical protein
MFMTTKKAASLANQERSNSRGGVGHARAGNEILETDFSKKLLKTGTARKSAAIGTGTAAVAPFKNGAIERVSMYSLIESDHRHKIQIRQAAMQVLQILLHCRNTAADWNGTGR